MLRNTPRDKKRFNDAVSRMMLAIMKKMAVLHHMTSTHCCALFLPRSCNPSTFATCGDFSEMVRIYSATALRIQTDKNPVLKLDFMALRDLFYSESSGAVYGHEAAVMLADMLGF